MNTEKRGDADGVKDKIETMDAHIRIVRLESEIKRLDREYRDKRLELEKEMAELQDKIGNASVFKKNEGGK